MIPSKQLMIGNWAHGKYENRNVFVLIARIDDDDTNENLYPVPLIHEILDKFEFKHIGESWYERGEISINIEDGRICITQNGGQVFLDRNIKTVHEFQNAYYWLTGKELNFQA